MNIFHDFTDRIKKAVQEAPIPTNKADLARIGVEPPREASHGDLATNAALVLAKSAGKAPRDLAGTIAAAMAADADVEGAEVAGPGFLNLRLKPAYWHAALGAIVHEGAGYGESDIGQAAKVNVEYVSANPTGPMHVGHGRGAVFGDAVANLLAAAGYAVTREFYINDSGSQVDQLARSAYLRYLQSLGDEIGDMPEDGYPGDYLIPVGDALAERFGESLKQMEEEDDWLSIAREAAIEMMMDTVRADLALLNIRHDVFFSERSLTTGAVDRVAEAIDRLAAQHLIYRGTLPPPKGQLPPDWEDREQTLFRSTTFGDDVDRPLMKSDGSYTYFASDIAYHYDKYLRGFRDMIDVWGADHGGYVRRMSAAVQAISGGEARLEVKLCQLVRLFRAGEPVKMSKRSGAFTTLREAVEEVGRDPIRFMMVFRKNDAPLDFDFAKVTEQSKDNPVFYVQYAHARTASIFRQAGGELPGLAKDPAALAAAPLERLDDPGEMALIRRLAEYPRVIEAAAEAREPHRVAFYLHDLAAEFHAQWNRGKELPHLRFISAREFDLTLARLALVHAIKLVLCSGLTMLGVSAPEEMR